MAKHYTGKGLGRLKRIYNKANLKVFAKAIKAFSAKTQCGDKIVPFYCKNCGYIELYRKMKG